MPSGGEDRARAALRRALAAPHLPQGAPSSPHLANLCVQRLDRRLAGYAAAAGAVYTRYADDLTFSGAAGLAPARLVRAVTQIVAEEGFTVNRAKTRVQRATQRQLVTGWSSTTASGWGGRRRTGCAPSCTTPCGTVPRSPTAAGAPTSGRTSRVAWAGSRR